MIFASSPDRRAGFTLVEMAIVLSIIGILTGAIMAGQHLLHTMRLKRINEQAMQYTAAVQQFADRYRSLPGDSPVAINYWGTVASGGLPCTGPTSASGGNGVGSGTGTETCNGNGDYQIGNYSTANLRHEMFRAWQHLSRADLITGSYTGIRANTTSNLSHLCPGNCPPGPLKGSGWSFVYSASLAASGSSTNRWPNRTLGNMLLFGGPIANDLQFEGLLTPQEAWDLDKKYDDASPVTGNIFAVFNGGTNNANCTTASGSSSTLTATYSTTTDTVSCALYFLLPADLRGPQ